MGAPLPNALLSGDLDRSDLLHPPTLALFQDLLTHTGPLSGSSLADQ